MPSCHDQFHGLILHLDQTVHILAGNDSQVYKPQYLIQDQNLTFSNGQYHLGKIVAIKNVHLLFLLLFFRQIFIKGFFSLEPEDLDLRFQSLQVIQPASHLTLQKLNDKNLFLFTGADKCTSHR